MAPGSLRLLNLHSRRRPEPLGGASLGPFHLGQGYESAAPEGENINAAEAGSNAAAGAAGRACTPVRAELVLTVRWRAACRKMGV